MFNLYFYLKNMPLAGASLQLVPIILRACSSHKEPKPLLSSRHKL